MSTNNKTKEQLIKELSELRRENASLKAKIGSTIRKKTVITKPKPEDTFRESELKYSLLFEQAPCALTIARLEDGVIEDVNESFENLLGYSKQEVIGKTSLELGLNPDVEQSKELINLLKEQVTIINRELTLKTKSGEERIIALNMNVVEIAGQSYMFSNAHDITERKKTEAALIESEEQFRLIYKNSQDGIFLTKPDGTILSANPAACKILQMTEEEIYIGGRRGIVDINDSRLKILLEERLTTGKAIGELNFIRKDGTIFPGEVSTSIFTDKNGEIKTTMIFRDISERKRAEEALIESEKRYREVVEGAIEFIYTTDLNGNIINFNKACLNITGYPIEEFTKMNYLELIIPEFRNRVRFHYIKQYMSGIHSTYTEYPIRNRQGKIIWLGQNATLLIESGEIIGFHIIARDITERKMAEDALRESQQILEGIMNAIPIRVFWKDKSLKYLGCNKIFAEDAGYRDPRDLIGKDDYQLGWSEQADLYRADDRQVIESGIPKLFIEEPQSTPDGKVITLLTSKLPLRNSLGEINGILGIYVDITERKMTEEAFRESEEKYRLLIEHLPDGIMIHSDGKIVFANQATIDIFGGDKNKIIGSQVLDFVHPDYLPTVKDRIKTIVNNKKDVPVIEEKLVKLDGTVFDAEVTAIPFNYLGKPSVQVLVHDITKRKSAEVALKESEEKFRSLVENSLEGIYVLKGRKYVYVNPRYCEITGFSYDELTNPEFDFSILATEESAEFLEMRYKSRKEGLEIPSNYNIKIKDKNGEKHDLIINTIQQSSKREVDIIGFVIDETKRKLAEESLRESEQKYRYIVDNSLAGIYQITLDGNIIYGNEFMINMMEYDGDDYISINILQFYKNPNQRERLLSEIKANGEVKDFEVELSTFKGNTITVLINSRLEGNILSGIVYNITERKKAEEELSKLRKAVETSGEVIFMTNTDGIITFINPEFTNLYGWQPDEVLGKVTPRIMKSGITEPEFYINLWNTLLNKEVFKWEVQNKTKEGSFIFIESSANPILDDKGNITGFLAIQKDISDRKRIEQEILFAKEKAEDMNRLKSSFLANMSHELRTPMNGIMGFSQILQYEEDINNVHEITGLVYKSSKRLMETLNSILDLSRIESGDMYPVYNYADVIDLAKETINLYQSDAQRNGIELKLDTDIDNYYISTDQKLVIDILNNLVNNAIKFTPDGEVVLAIKKLITDNKEFVLLEVRDTGIGVHEKDYDTIFDEFRQASEGLNRGFEGTGLGLTLTKKYVELLGGTIKVRSKLGEGSTFTVSLPVYDKLLTETESDIDEFVTVDNINDVDKKSVKPMILYVEDDEVSILLVDKILSNGFDMEYAKSYEEAMSKVKEDLYSMILMDINLGKGKNGLDATKDIRKMNKYKDVPIIAVTAFAMQGDREEFISGGCNDYLSKPFNKADLLNIVNKYSNISK
ncbi:MAG: PAS domain S-box protein [Bacteroidetes bacterium]|nr:MAG: PAS domain S-box protein [Bacteroidota bacterium]